jgi:hypothetical protein
LPTSVSIRLAPTGTGNYTPRPQGWSPDDEQNALTHATLTALARGSPFTDEATTLARGSPAADEPTTLACGSPSSADLTLLSRNLLSAAELPAL